MSMSREAIEALRASGIFPGPGPMQFDVWHDEPEPSPEPDECRIPPHQARKKRGVIRASNNN